MSNKNQFNPKRDLPYLSALSQTAQFALAGSVLLGLRGWIFGALLGALISVTMAYAASQYDTVAKTRRPFVLAGMVLLGLFSPVIIGTSMFLDLPAVLHPIWRGIVGAVWGVLPDASVALTGFVAGKGLVKQDEKPIATTAETVAQVDEKPKKPEKQLRKPITDTALIAEIKKQPGATDEQLAAIFGVSRQAINNRRRKLTPADMGLVKERDA